MYVRLLTACERGQSAALPMQRLQSCKAAARLQTLRGHCPSFRRPVERTHAAATFELENAHNGGAQKGRRWLCTAALMKFDVVSDDLHCTGFICLCWGGSVGDYRSGIRPRRACCCLCYLSGSAVRQDAARAANHVLGPDGVRCSTGRACRGAGCADVSHLIAEVQLYGSHFTLTQSQHKSALCL